MNGAELAAKREKVGLTQEQLAGYLGIGRTSVWRLETGKEQISRPIEALSHTLEPGNQTLEKWLSTLTVKKRQMILHRQHRRNFQVASIKP